MLCSLVSSIISHHRWFAFDGARGVNDLLCTISVNVHAIQSLLLPCCQSLVKLKPMISKLQLVSTQKFVWHVCIVCMLFQGDKDILSICLYDCLCLCARLCPRVPHNIHTETWCPMCLCVQLYQTTIIQRDVCVAQCPLCVELSLIHIWRCRRSTLCRSRWSPYH